MPRQLKVETVTNIADKFGKLQAAISDVRQARTEIEESVKNGSAATPEGMQKFQANMNAITRNQKVASDCAQYLGSIFGVFLAEIGEKNPETMISVFRSVKDDLPNIVDAINETKNETRQNAKEREAAKVAEAARKLIEAQQKKAK